MRAIQTEIIERISHLTSNSTNKNILLIGNTGVGKTLPVICHLRDQYVERGRNMIYLIAVPSQALGRQWIEQLVQYGQYPFLDVRDDTFNQNDIVQVNTYEVILESLSFHLNKDVWIILVIDEIQVIREEYRSPVINAMLTLMERYQTRGSCICMGSDFSEDNIQHFRDMGYGVVCVEHTRFPENVKPYLHGSMAEMILWEYIIHLDSGGLVVVFMNTKQEIIRAVNTLIDEIKARGLVMQCQYDKLPLFQYQTCSGPVMESLKYRIGIHFRGVERGYLRFVEQLLRQGTHINILFTTTTLSEGMNIPSIRTIFLGNNQRFRWSSGHIRQIMGRTNRLNCGIVLIENNTHTRFINGDSPPVLTALGKYRPFLDFVINHVYPEYCNPVWMDNLRSNYSSYYITYNIIFQLCRMYNFDHYNSMVIALVMTYSNSLDFRNVRLSQMAVDPRIGEISSLNGLFVMDASKLTHYTTIVSKIIKYRFAHTQRQFICDLFVRMYNSIRPILQGLGMRDDPLVMLMTEMIWSITVPDPGDDVKLTFQGYCLEYETEEDPAVVPEKKTVLFDVVYD
jgi:hypothetical protein